MKANGALPFQTWRYGVIYGLMLLAATLFSARLFILQILENPQWLARATENRTREIFISPRRGIIYDRNGYLLARNIASYNIVITPAYLPDDPADVQRIYRELSRLTGMPVSQGTVEQAKGLLPCSEGPGIAEWVELGASNAPYEPVKIQCNVSETIAMIVRERAVDWPGVAIEIKPLRDYPSGYLTANIVGFLGPIPASQEAAYKERGFQPGEDKVGYAGVELSMNDVLIGQPGRRVVEVDVAGKELRNLEPPVAPKAGYNVILTIDTRLQNAAEAVLRSEIEWWNRYYYGNTGEMRISSGVVIAMNPKTGEILAMAQYPSYENNRMARFIPAYYFRQLVEEPRHPLLNYAISYELPPGSTFKLVTGTAALNEGIVTLDQIIQAPGKIVLEEKFAASGQVSEREYHDWIYDTRPEGFGTIDFLHCIAFSSNVCFYKLGGGYKDEIPEGVDIDRIKTYARALGYDQVSGIELPGEAAGLIPDPTWKRRTQGENWSTGDTYLAAVGQGFVLATPLQVLLSAATIANDGRQMQPTIIRGVVDASGQPIEMYWNADGTVTPQPKDEKSRRISPFEPQVRWDITRDPIITDYVCSGGYCQATGLMKTVQPWVVEKIQQGMHMATTEPGGTLNREYSFQGYPIAVGGKTGTAEYCDAIAEAKGRCLPGQWPSHAWTVAYAPFDDPEIIIVAFAYNAGEGGSVAAPIVKKVMDAYFDLKAADMASGRIGP